MLQINHTANQIGEDQVEVTVSYDSYVEKFRFGLEYHSKIFPVIVVQLEEYDLNPSVETIMLQYAQDAAELWMLYNSEKYNRAMVENYG